MKQKKTLILTLAAVFCLTFAGIAAATYQIDESVEVDGSGTFKSIRIGQEGVGGVTFFNGTIVNETTTSGVGNPVTFGDDVRIDGEIWRGEVKGAGAAEVMPVKINDDLKVYGDLDVDGDVKKGGVSLARMKRHEGNFDATADGDVIKSDAGATYHWKEFNVPELKSSTAMIYVRPSTALSVEMPENTWMNIGGQATSVDFDNGKIYLMYKYTYGGDTRYLTNGDYRIEVLY